MGRSATPSSHPPKRVTHVRWSDLRRSSEYQGRWVALDKPRYDEATREPVEGDLVDADEDLGALCARMRQSSRTACAIVFCEAESPLSRRVPRTMH